MYVVNYNGTWDFMLNDVITSSMEWVSACTCVHKTIKNKRKSSRLFDYKIINIKKPECQMRNEPIPKVP